MIEKKVRMGTCEECHEKMEYRLLYTIFSKKMCLACGNEEIAKWNRIVAEAEQVERSVPTGKQKG